MQPFKERKEGRGGGERTTKKPNLRNIKDGLNTKLRDFQETSTSPIATRCDRGVPEQLSYRRDDGQVQLQGLLAVSEETSSQSVPAFLGKHLKKLLKISIYPSCTVKQPWGWDLIPGLACTPEFANRADFISESQQEP